MSGFVGLAMNALTSNAKLVGTVADIADKGQTVACGTLPTGWIVTMVIAVIIILITISYAISKNTTDETTIALGVSALCAVMLVCTAIATIYYKNQSLLRAGARLIGVPI